jgi:hypothetical protein
VLAGGVMLAVACWRRALAQWQWRNCAVVDWLGLAPPGL